MNVIEWPQFRSVIALSTLSAAAGFAKTIEAAQGDAPTPATIGSEISPVLGSSYRRGLCRTYHYEYYYHYYAPSYFVYDWDWTYDYDPPAPTDDYDKPAYDYYDCSNGCYFLSSVVLGCPQDPKENSFPPQKYVRPKCAFAACLCSRPPR